MKANILLLTFFSLSNLNLLFSSTSYPTPVDVVREYYAAIDGGNIPAAGMLLAETCTVTAPFSSAPFDKKSWMGVGQSLVTAFPEMKHNIAQYIETGNTVVARGVFSGQNNGHYMGNPPSGNQVQSPFITVFELDHSWKIKSIYLQFDQKSFEMQLAAGLTTPEAVALSTVRGIMTAADAADVALLTGYFDKQAVHYFGGIANTTEELKSRVKAFKTGFPDIHRELKVLSYTNGTITLQGWLTGTHLGEFMDLPASGKKIRVSVLGVYHINTAGKVTEAWIELDSASLLRQISPPKQEVRK